MSPYQQHVEAVPELVPGEDDGGQDVAEDPEDADRAQDHAFQPELELQVQKKYITFYTFFS